MAAHSETYAKTFTLTANTEDTVQLGVTGVVQVFNFSTEDTAWVRIDGTAATVAGDDCYPVPPGGVLELNPTGFHGAQPPLVSVISSGTPQVWVGVLPR